MMSSGKQKYPKYLTSKVKHLQFEVKVVGGIDEHSTSESKKNLHGVVGKLKDTFVSDGRVNNKTNATPDQNKQYVRFKLTIRGKDYKPSAFEVIRKEWLTNVCRPGDPFWLESCEDVRSTYRNQANAPRHSLEPESFSLGSFLNRATFVEHYSTNNDALLNQERVYVEFQHDMKTLEITCFEKVQALFIQNKEYKLTYDYKQFDNYILVDETQSGISIYIPLLRPPKVINLVSMVGKGKPDETRCVEFSNCDKDVLGMSCVLKLTFSESGDDKPLELVTRLAKMGRSIYFCSVSTVLPKSSTQVPQKPSFQDFHVAYALECLLSRGFKVSDRVTSGFYQMLRDATSSSPYSALRLPRFSSSRRFETRQLSSPQICRALYQLIAYVEENRFCPLEKILEQLLFGKFKKKVALDFEVPKHYVYVPRVIVTPTQNYLVQPELVAENRVIREYGHEFAMRIAFRDEDFSKLASFSASLSIVLQKRVQDVLSEGIQLCGRHFQFLACSNSQLRDHGAWLYAHDGTYDAEHIRNSLGNLDDIRCVATYVSRMGQCFSSTKESVKVSISEGVKTDEIPDISKEYKNEYFECCRSFRSGTYTFSDGVGKISMSLAKKIAKSLELKDVPSAFQIRYAGCKGMLAIDTSLPQREHILQYRRSMRKFDSQHQDLEICEHSKPNALYLNRQCITLLSGMGVEDNALIKLQDKMLINLASMLLSEGVALNTLNQTSIPGGLKAKYLRKSGIMVTCEPFFRSLLLAIYKSKLNDLLRKARIAIPHSDGRLLIGVLDESQKLEYGQVFIRYSKDISEPNKEYVTLTGNVVVTKNPCFHPGDLRKFEAVDIKSLYHLVDCIVFPSKGPRPHTDEMSGSDLDGDKYFATWHKPLIPPLPNASPMDFPSAQKKLLDEKVQVGDMIQFVAEYIKNDQLGVIANAHLVHADIEDKGIHSDKCIKLAHMHSDAVDFPKTGKCPSLTQDLRPEKYPDFMMKTDKPRYNSSKVIGKLFQKCNQLERARYFTSNDESKDKEPLRVDEDLIVNGYEKFVETALQKREQYNTKLGSLMALYGLKDEGEVLTGCLTRVNSRLSGKTDEKFEVAQLIHASLASLRNNLKSEFYQEFGGEEEVKEYFQENQEYPTEVLRKASAWYHVTYNQTPVEESEAQTNEEEIQSKRDEWSMSEHPLLSFPWIVSPLLAHIKSLATAQDQETGHRYKELENISKLITAQAKQMFDKENLQELMKGDLDARQIWRDAVGHLPLLGASMIGLNILDKNIQPVQLYAPMRWDATEEMELVELTKWQERIRGYLYLKSMCIGKYGKSERSLCLSFVTQDDRMYFIVSNPFEMLKSMYIQSHIMKAPMLLPLLMVITHWGRKKCMIGSHRDSFMDIEDLAMMFIHFCVQSKFIGEIQPQEVKDDAEQFMRNVNYRENMWKTMILSSIGFTNTGFFVEPGLTLIKFWEFYGSYFEDHALNLKRVRNPMNHREKLLSYLTPDEIQRFTDSALHTFHQIAQRRGLDALLVSIDQESLKEETEIVPMPHSTLGTLRFAEDFVAYGLSSLTKAKVNIKPAPKGAGYTLEVTGNYISLTRCQAERHRLEQLTRDHHVYDHVIKSGRRFIFMDQSSGDDRVIAKQLKKDFAVNLINGLPMNTIDESKLIAAVEEQLQVYKNSHLAYLHGSKDVSISLEYGSIYVTNAHRWVMGSTVDAVEKTLSKGLTGSKNTEIKGKFLEVQKTHDPLPLPVTFQPHKVSSKKIYIVELKITNNHKITVELDENLEFVGFRFEPFKWLDVQMKSLRPASSRTADIDLRIILSTKRELTTDECKTLPIYETYGKRPILERDRDGRLSIAREYKRREAHVLAIDETTHLLRYNESIIYHVTRKIQKYNARNIGRKPDREYTTVTLNTEIKVHDDEKKLVQEIFHVGKRWKPW